MMDEKVQVRLERFLSWLLDARWFPESDVKEKARRRSELQRLQRILTRMKDFSEGNPHRGLQEGIAKWQAYEANLVVLAKQHIRSSPHTSIGDSSKASREISERLMCATLLVRKLYPQVHAYEEIQRLLADPSQLPSPITQSEGAMRAKTGNGTGAASELSYWRGARDIPIRPYWLSVEAIQSRVERLGSELGQGKRSAQRWMLHELYKQFLWSQWYQGAFTDAETAMLDDLVPLRVHREGPQTLQE